MEVTRHFTATTFVVYDNQVLLHWHPKLQMWLPVGGHIDRDELPEEAAKREVWEEAGLAVTLHHAHHTLYLDDARQLTQPAHVVLEDINPHHQHIDLIFFATSATTEVAPAADESQVLQWFTADDLRRWNIPDNARQLGLEAVQILGTNAAD